MRPAVSSYTTKEKSPGAKIFGDALNSIINGRRENRKTSEISSKKREKNKEVAYVANFKNLKENFPVTSDNGFPDYESISSENNCAFFESRLISDGDQALASVRQGGSSKHTLRLCEVLPPVTQRGSSRHTLRLSEVVPSVGASRHALRLIDMFSSEPQRVSSKHSLLLCEVLPAPSHLSPCNNHENWENKSSSDSGLESMDDLKSDSWFDSVEEKRCFLSEPLLSSSPESDFESFKHNQVVPSYLVTPSMTDFFVKSDSKESLSVLQLTSDDDTESGKSSPTDIDSFEEKETLHHEFEKKSEAQCFQNLKNKSTCSSYSGSLPEYSLEHLLTYESPGFIDSHCHLDLVLRRRNFPGSFSEFRKKFSSEFPLNYEGCIAIFCYPDSFRKKYLWSKHLDDADVWTSFGCHPKKADFYSDEVERDLSEALTHHKVRALGEIGLDYSNGNYCLVHVQQSVFRRQLMIAVAKNLPLVIHCREAHEDCFHMMKLYVPKDHKIHMHCFKASWTWAEKWLNEFPNLCIGITSCVTYPGSKAVHEVVRKIPLNRLLLETDAPYFVPNAIHKDNQWTHPGMAIHVAAQVAVLKQVPLREVLHNTLQNTKKLYNL